MTTRKKIIIGIAIILAVVGLYSLLPKGGRLGFGIYSATNSTVNCSGGTSTLVVAAQSDRTSFIASRTGGQIITLCRAAAGCASGSAGIILATTTGDRFEQTDDYVGAYSCVGGGGTSTLGITY